MYGKFEDTWYRRVGDDFLASTEAVDSYSEGFLTYAPRGTEAVLRSLLLREVSLAVLLMAVENRQRRKDWIGDREAHRSNEAEGRDTFANGPIDLQRISTPWTFGESRNL